MDKIRAAVELMAQRQAAGVLHRRRRHQLRPARVARCCANSSRLTGFPITSTLMGLGAYPASDPQFLGMLGMHGTYEANLAMHECDVMINIGARFDDRITGRLDAFSPVFQEDPRRHRPVLDQQERQGRHRRSSATARTCWRTWSRLWRADAPQVDKAALEGLVGARSRAGAARNCLAYRPSTKPIKPQYAVAAPLRADQGPRHLHHDRGRPAPDVGGAVLPASRSRTAG